MTSEADLRMELSISRILQVGVGLSALVVLIGGGIYLVQAHGVVPDYRHFHGAASPADRSRSMIHLGILLLIATPVMRVAFCVYGFARQRDKRYVAISAIVLAVLLYSFFHP